MCSTKAEHTDNIWQCQETLGAHNGLTAPFQTWLTLEVIYHPVGHEG